MAKEETSLVIGRGEVYFDAFAPGTREGQGELYIGNTSTFQVGRTLERLDRFTSYRGQKVEKESAVISEKHTVNFVTDHISIDNIGLWYGEEAQSDTHTGVNILYEALVVKQGRYYQLGKPFRYTGVRELDEIYVFVDSVMIPAAGNFEKDLQNGRLYIVPGSTKIFDNAPITVGYEWRTTDNAIAQSKPKDVYGALRFVPTNVIGQRFHYFFPFVRIAPRGLVDLKGDEWQQIPFEIEAMRLSPKRAQVYIDGVTRVGTTEDEQAIIDLGGMTLGEFPFYEDQFHTVINVEIPAAGYGVPK